MKLPFVLIFIATAILEIIQKNSPTCSKNISRKKEITWSQRVIRKIKRDPKIYQAMLITNLENFNSTENEIIQDLEKNVPTFHFNYSQSKREIEKIEKLPSFSNPRDTTLFLILESSNKTKIHSIEKIMSQIKKLTKNRIRPKCLIIHRFFENSNYSQFLEKMWLDLFLDLSILEVTVGNKIMIHYLNPFFYSYQKRLLGQKTLLFPEKLKNLNQYPMKVGIYNRPPFTKLNFNSSDYLVNISGLDVQLGNIFSEVLNFRQIFVPSRAKDNGIISCYVNNLTGFYSMIVRREIQYISVTTTNIKKMCENADDFFENAMFATDYYIAIIPKFNIKHSSIMIGMNFYYSIVMHILLTIIVVIIGKKCQFDEKIWNWTSIFQILFGVAIKYQPRKFFERIIFGCLLIIYFYYSISIFESLTDFHFQIEEEREIRTLNDLIKSGLQFNSELGKLTFLPGFVKEESFTNWAKKGFVITYEKCLAKLLKYKNVTCVMRLTHADWFAGFHREQNLVKFVPEFITSVGVGFILEPGSPYVEKMQKIYRIVTEFALLKKWRIRNSSNNESEIDEIDVKVELLNESYGEWKLVPLLIGIMIIGYFVSLLTFIAELIVDKWRRRGISVI